LALKSHIIPHPIEMGGGEDTKSSTTPAMKSSISWRSAIETSSEGSGGFGNESEG